MEDEYVEEENGNLNNMDEEDNIRIRVFSELKHYSLILLELLQNPKKNVPEISQLHEFLRKTPSHALQPLLDYAMFPLLLLLDAAVGSRSSKKDDFEGKAGLLGVSNTPNAVSDSVAEGVVLCLEELLKKCYLGSVNQMVVVLKKLTYGAMLSPSEASEEFREGIVRCFKALLLRLQPCSIKSCACNQIHGFPALIASSKSPSLSKIFSKRRSESVDCLLAYLQSQNASAAVGHWLSLLLKVLLNIHVKIADTEAAQGHRGSANIRVEAFLTLRVLVAKVGTAQALAFFLPGVVSHFTKVLQMSKTMISGAAGSTEAIDQATRGLVEFLMIVLQDKANISGLDMSNGTTGFHLSEDKSTCSFVEALRHLPVNSQKRVQELETNPSDQAVVLKDIKDKKINNHDGLLCVNRTNDWLKETSAHVDKLLSATFPHLCVHPARKVRQGLVQSIQGLLSECSYTLKQSRLMMLECLCVLVCDDSEEVSIVAQEFLESFFMGNDKDLIQHEIAEIFNRLVEKLPKLVLGSDETNAVAYAQRLLSVMYYCGPQLVVDNLLRSPITASRFMEVLMLCLGQNSGFAGSLDKFILDRPSSVGYLHSIAELKFASHFSCTAKHLPIPLDSVHQNYEVPNMPPWFVYVGSQKLYNVLAGILRLVGLSLVADSRKEVSLSVIVEIPLIYLRKLISEVRMKQYSKESWKSWYGRSGSGQLVRQASTAVCILNEIIYGTSDQSVERFFKMFRTSRSKGKELQGCGVICSDDQSPGIENGVSNESVWKICSALDARSHLTDCIGSILHEYLSPEVWDIPIDPDVSLIKDEVEDMKSHSFHDTAKLHQVIIDGIGTFNVCLGKEFSTSGFLHSSLYLLLENLICSSSEIRRTADAVLHVISSTSGYPTVGCLVVSNADYIIDSLCRELRHLDLNPHVPNVIASMLSYVGVANEILPLLEEPMRSVSLELEVLGRHQHPNLTVPFLKGVAEIAKASKCEAYAMPTKAEAYSVHVKSKVSDMEETTRKECDGFTSSYGRDTNVKSMETDDVDSTCNVSDMHVEHWEKMLFELNDSKRYRRIVGSIAGSCLTAATPLVASLNESAALVALDIINDGIAALAKVEEAYRHEKGSKQQIERAIQLCSFHDLEDTLDAADETDENRLLPAMNKIWPYFVTCIKNKNPLVIRRCLNVVSSTVQICGGDFFSRRFHTDGPHFWKMLTTSPFSKKSILSDEKKPLQLPYRISSTSSEDSMAETSGLKVQTAALTMIANLSRNKRSASALDAVLKKISGLVVGIACSGVVGLHDASVNALSGLACIDPDLIWLLLADVYYSFKSKDAPSPPFVGLPEIAQLVPSPSSHKEFLFAQYGGDTFGFGVDVSSVEKMFQKMNKEVFTWQMDV
ncbi:Arm repeat superfamily protein [Thalictrum thalictroides]|uniref:Arm repeat superfamily protein n=1 Tax=Thalictrum thalictroides TaxID=46969 RepID=A0A7J6VFZ2_THATH|nr:Arm repeat superfamily protein [Thalictrum thalictroides]